LLPLRDGVPLEPAVQAGVLQLLLVPRAGGHLLVQGLASLSQ
jgi:hypothetical protein